MDDEERGAVRVRSLAYAGGAACFALILVILPMAKPFSWHTVALLCAAFGLPSFVAAGWMAETTLRYSKRVTFVPSTSRENEPVVHMIAAGSLGLLGGIAIELWSADTLTGAIFTLALLVAMRMVSVHRSRFEKAIKGPDDS